MTMGFTETAHIQVYGRRAHSLTPTPEGRTGFRPWL
jgi:hypothetical protein